MSEFLMEIGLEEIPAHLVTPAIDQLVERSEALLKEQRLAFSGIDHYSTPRRLAILVHDVAERAEDFEEELKGPIKRAALDADGNFTKAAAGFARGKGMTTDDIVFKEFNGQEFVTLTRHEDGKPAAEVLAGFDAVVKAMTFSTTMKWGRHTFEYVRPIRWMVALLDEQVVDFNVLDVQTGRNSRGHRFLGHDVVIQTASTYVKQLADQFVIADAKTRKQLIQTQIQQLATEHAWQVVMDADLLEEVNNIVEYPTAFVGQFDAEYLQLPDEVLITSMREHQRFFHVQDQAGKLLPYFVSVRNGNDQHLDNVIAGNEKVLVARLEDAKFFYQEDQKHSIDDYNEKLEVVSFHEKLGSVAAHTRRTKQLASQLGQALGVNADDQATIARASEIYKFDLMTGMVGEFDELQGVMGEKYALLFEETPAVGQAIREHYLPISADGALPESVAGQVLAVADKLDTLLSFFAGDMVPSGSNDPYALRRAAAGMVAIMSAEQWHVDLMKLLTDYIKKLQATPDSKGLPEDVLNNLMAQRKVVLQFLTDRVMKELQRQGIRQDIITAVTDNQNSDMTGMLEAAQVLQAQVEQANFRAGVEALTRVVRLTIKNPVDAQVDSALFENQAERALQAAMDQFNPANLTKRLQALLGLTDLITAYFNETMVMVEDTAVQTNRLATLAQVSDATKPLANFLDLQVK
ncbi:glycine--tRNA ligase subunit beta [Weissella kandleri]|uniref:glycine--tRNA ligase subunit beta n=1 Tax=Weissella kandleri TaxID=1616 RepID=UPI00387E851E